MEVGTVSLALDEVIKRLRSCNIHDVYTANLTIDEIPTYRVFIPKLEFIPKFHYQHVTEPEEERRLYSIPKRMGFVEGVDYAYKSGLGNNWLI